MMLFRLAAARNKAPPGSGAVLFQLFLLAEEQGL